MQNDKNIRHSMLPKLAECPKYTPKPGEAGPAAQRGTVMDEAFRLALQGDRSKLEALPAEDRPAVEWAVALLEDYKRTGAVEAREEFLAMHTPGIAHVGTADALCERLGWVADLKTGAVRSYMEQLAAYSYACMATRFEQEWTAHVLYCDHQLVKSYRFTLEQARQIVEQIIAEVNDPAAEPRASEYCRWCANENTCPAVVRPVEKGLALAAQPVTSLETILTTILDSPERMGEFLAQWKMAEKMVAEPVEKAMRARLENGAEVRGWKLIDVKGREYYDAEGIVWAAKQANASLEAVVLAMGGTMSGKAYREWLTQLGQEPLNAHTRTGTGSKQLRQVKPAKTK
jgi:hypothetical protein